MSIFDGPWAIASRILHTAVDSVVGDRVRYRHNGIWLGSAPEGYSDAVVPAFIHFAEAPVNLDEINEIVSAKPRLKISKALVDRPLQSDRFQHPKLGAGWFRPAGSEPQIEGDYWIIEPQGASAP